MIIAKLMRHIKQQLVLGQLCAGIIIAILAHYKINFFATMVHNDILSFLAELGSIFLLFEIGLESNISEITHAGKHAITVALTGVIVPFILGYFIVTPLILNNLIDMQHINPNINHFMLNSNNLINHTTLRIFIGGILAVTSTGISISVFKELKLLKSQACQIVLAASIIDDIFGLMLLSIVTSLALSNSISIINLSLTLLYILLFFILGILFGQKLLPKIINLFAIINNSVDTLVLIMIGYALSMSFIASSIGLASVIGAFLAGLLLEENYFNKYKYPRYLKGQDSEYIWRGGSCDTKSINPINLLEHLIRPFGKLLTPIFFIYAGMQVDIIAALNFTTLKLTITISIFAICSKIVAGIWLPKNGSRLIVGIGMVPRGEIGLIFAISGLNLNIIGHETFTALLLMIIITSIFTPPVLTYATKKLIHQ
jgi:Kef-type K+ transport system membrane component KefB